MNNFDSIYVVQLVLLIGGALSFLFSLQAFLKYKQSRINIILSFIFFIIAFRLLIFPFFTPEVPTKLIIPQISLTLLLAVGPLVFLFIRYKLKLNKSSEILWLNIFHFIPLVIYLLIDLSIIESPSFNKLYTKSYIVLIVTLIYSTASLFFVLKNKHNYKIKNYKRKLTVFISPFVVTPIFIFFLIKYPGSFLGFNPGTIPYLIVSFLFYRMTFLSMVRGKNYFNDIFPTIRKTQLEIKESYRNSKVNELIHIMKTEKPYLEPDLNIEKLAEFCNMKKHELSVLINKEVKMGFNDFVNFWRVEEAKINLLSPSLNTITIVGIGHKSGFKSKSTFFESFKKYTGKTPIVYIKEK